MKNLYQNRVGFLEVGLAHDEVAALDNLHIRQPQVDRPKDQLHHLHLGDPARVIRAAGIRQDALLVSGDLGGEHLVHLRQHDFQ